MNHIYRRIWSAAKRCWVVGSELTNRGSGARRSISGGAGAALLMFSVNTMAVEDVDKEPLENLPEIASEEQGNFPQIGMHAGLPTMLIGLDSGVPQKSIAPQSKYYQLAIVNDVAYRDSTATGDDTVVVGSRSTISGKRSVGYGNGIRSTGERNVAIGTNVKIEHWYATAVGDGAYAGGGWGATAYGNDSRADGGNAIAIGSGSRVATGGGIGGIALGGDARAGTSGYSGAIAVGNKSTASYDAMAMGYEASASMSGSVALGVRSVANEANTVSVGNSSTKRRVVNVADARLNSTSSDAVTGKQLNATNGNVTAARSLADSAKTNADNALNKANTLGGLLSQTSASGNVRLGGSNSGAVLDVRNSANANRKITGVADATLSATSTEAVSGKQLNATNSNLTAARSVADSAKTNADSALSKASALSGLLSQTSASGNVRVGGSNSGTILDVRNSANANRKITGVADATISATSTEAVSGKQLNATNSNVTAARSVADTAKTSADSALTKANTLSGLLSQTATSGNVRLGAANSGTVLDVRNSANASRKITGVADAALSTTSTDAVTGRQLNTTNSNVSTALSDASEAKTTANTALTQVGTLNGLLSQASASGNVRIGEKNSGTVLDVRNSANANRRLTGVADGVVSASSYEAVNGRQLNATNDKVATVEGIARSAATEAGVAKTDAAKALAETAALGGLVAQVSASGSVRLGEKNGGTVLDVRNSAGGSRTITGVSDGTLNADSSDAINGKQLYAVSEVANGAKRSAQEAIDRIGSIAEQSKFLHVGSGGPNQGAKAGLVAVAIGDSAEASMTSEGAVAVGSFAAALAKNSVSLGRAAYVDAAAENGFSLGVFSSVEAGNGVALGAGSAVEKTASNSVAIGAGSVASEVNVVSFGAGLLQRRLVNVARGTADHDATTVSQLKDSIATLGGSAGMDANGNIIAPTYTVQGGTQNTVEDALMALDGAVITAGRRADKVEGQLNSIFQDSPSARADGMSQIALNGVNGMVLTNLADGRVAPGSRDAVNGGQLHSMQQQLNGRMDGLEQRIDDAPAPRALASSSVPKPQTEETPVLPGGKDSQQVASVGEGDKPTPQPKANKDDTPKPQVDTAELEKMLARANEYTDGAISNFERRLDKMDKRFNRMAAMSSAQSAMAMNTAGLATYNRLGAGVGYSEGESAMAVGYQRVLNEKGSATFSLNGAFTNSGERSMGVGVGIGW
ncbi:ESPR-type extended signal peptide-containing protein [Stenotrophomonas maltophilia]|uniref:ESPR-type extended signal peptide-containing protein n=1 Tax=Stenotrophomonas maltophilia TaxID=40324 RepID=UPI0015DCD938|nr:ESPR-type extended signal peptide-containing protein [Stenotrophomonas maltophilia]QDL29304.1 autotransporter [Stenotrophomonas maltophilia]